MNNISDLNQSLENLETNQYDSSLIQDNKIIFVFDKQVYRVRMPSQAEQSLAEHQKNCIQLKYIQEEGCITKAQLIQKLKDNKIVDIHALENEKENLVQELKQHWYNLALKSASSEETIKPLQDTIFRLKEKIQKLTFDILSYLNPALETRLEKYYVEILTVLCAEKQVEKEWQSIWKDYSEFEKTESIFTNTVIAHMTWLLLNKRV